MESEGYEGNVVYSKHYYGDLFARKDRKSFHGSKPTESEEAEAYRTMLAASGSYTIAGTKLTRNEEYCRNPNGGPQTYKLRLEGDLMVLTAASGIEWRFRRAD